MTSPAAPSSPPSASPTPGPTHRSAGGEFSRRTIVLSALVLFGALLLGIAAIAAFSDPGTPDATSSAAGTPRIIARPNSGATPQNPGDRGGSEQIILMIAMVAAIAGIGFTVFRGGPKARANRARWKAAGHADHDGAI